MTVGLPTECTDPLFRESQNCSDKKTLIFFFTFPGLSGKFGNNLEGSVQQIVSFLVLLAFLYQNENPSLIWAQGYNFVLPWLVGLEPHGEIKKKQKTECVHPFWDVGLEPHGEIKKTQKAECAHPLWDCGARTSRVRLKRHKKRNVQCMECDHRNMSSTGGIPDEHNHVRCPKRLFRLWKKI